MEEEEEPLDPRVQIELDRLNASSDEINRLENKLEEANALFRSTLSDSTASLKLLAGRLGSTVEKARPYYEAREDARRTQQECQRAAVQFQRASVLHQNARETIQLAEQRFLPRGDAPTGFQFDNAWQEMLNHATMKVLEAERLKNSSEHEHLRRAQNFADAQTKLKRLERSLEKSIGRARPYFEQREVVQGELLRQKTALQQLQRAVAAAKARYSASLRELENISEQIHEQRRLRELEPDLVPVDLDTCDLGSMSAIGESTTSDYEEDFRLSQEQQYWTEMREQIEAMSAAIGPPTEEGATARLSPLSIDTAAAQTLPSVLPAGSAAALSLDAGSLAAGKLPNTSESLLSRVDSEETGSDASGGTQEGRDEVDGPEREEVPLAEELSVARLIARRRRFCSEAASVPEQSGEEVEARSRRQSLPGAGPEARDDGDGGRDGVEVEAVTAEADTTSDSGTSVETVASASKANSADNIAGEAALVQNDAVVQVRSPPANILEGETAESLPVFPRNKIPGQSHPDLNAGAAVNANKKSVDSADAEAEETHCPASSDQVPTDESSVVSTESVLQADRSISEEEVLSVTNPASYQQNDDSGNPQKHMQSKEIPIGKASDETIQKEEVVSDQNFGFPDGEDIIMETV